MRRSQFPRGFGLIEMVVVIIIIALLVVLVVLPVMRGQSEGEEEGPAASPIQRAQSVECQSNLRQIGMAIQMYQTQEDTRLTQLDQLEPYGVIEEIRACPDSGEPYEIDSLTMSAVCSTPGHGNP